MKTNQKHYLIHPDLAALLFDGDLVDYELWSGRPRAITLKVVETPEQLERLDAYRAAFGGYAGYFSYGSGIPDHLHRYFYPGERLYGGGERLPPPHRARFDFVPREGTATTETVTNVLRIRPSKIAALHDGRSQRDFARYVMPLVCSRTALVDLDLFSYKHWQTYCNGAVSATFTFTVAGAPLVAHLSSRTEKFWPMGISWSYENVGSECDYERIRSLCTLTVSYRGRSLRYDADHYNYPDIEAWVRKILVRQIGGWLPFELEIPCLMTPCGMLHYTRLDYRPLISKEIGMSGVAILDPKLLEALGVEALEVPASILEHPLMVLLEKAAQGLSAQREDFLVDTLAETFA